MVLQSFLVIYNIMNYELRIIPAQNASMDMSNDIVNDSSPNE